MTDPWAAMDASAQAEAVRRGEVSALELVDAAISRAEVDVQRAEALAFAASEPSVSDIGLGAPRWKMEERVARLVGSEGVSP